LNRRHVDHRPAAIGDHERNDVFGEKKDRLQIDGHHAVPFVLRHVDNRAVPFDARRIQKAGYRSHLGSTPRCCRALIASRDIGDKRFDALRCDFRESSLVDVDRQDPGPALGEIAGALSAKARRCTRNNHDAG